MTEPKPVRITDGTVTMQVANQSVADELTTARWSVVKETTKKK